MKGTIHSVKLFFLLLLAGILVSACYPSSYIDIQYRLPRPSDVLAGQRVFLELKDERTQEAVLRERAEAKFTYFTGSFALTLNEGPEGEFPVGAYDAPALFREAFKRRLKNLGMEVTPARTAQEPVIEIALKKFSLDRIGHKWVTTIRYEASLIKDKKVVAKQAITGTAERFSWLGQRDAEKVMGDIFTDTLNNLEVERLFQQAGF